MIQNRFKMYPGVAVTVTGLEEEEWLLVVNQNMILYLSTNQKVIIFHPRGEGQELSWTAGLD